MAFRTTEMRKNLEPKEIQIDYLMETNEKNKVEIDEMRKKFDKEKEKKYMEFVKED